MTRRKKCALCRTSFEPASNRQAYCSRSCRNKAFRKRDATKNVAALRLSETNEWYTPADLIGKARRVLGAFDLDPASCAEANEVVQAAAYYSEDDDGLAHAWHGRIWLNPPYGRIAGKFVEHLTEQRRHGRIESAIVLVNAHSTDARWFWPLWDGVLCFTYQRLDFTAGGGRRQGSTHGSVLAYFGDDPDAFATEFKDVGAIVRRGGLSLFLEHKLPGAALKKAQDIAFDALRNQGNTVVVFWGQSRDGSDITHMQVYYPRMWVPDAPKHPPVKPASLADLRRVCSWWYRMSPAPIYRYA